MGKYINIGSEGFKRSRNSEYIDKSGLIAAVNKTLFTEQSFTCVTRCRRFGKSMAAKMLSAYYDHSCDSRSLFTDLEIARHPTFEQHLNHYPVIYLDMTEFVTRYHDDSIVGLIDQKIREDLLETYPDVPHKDSDDLMDSLLRVATATGHHFIFIIDEWDAICREFEPGAKAMDLYVNWLRRLFKGVSASNVFAGVYMTGILPIKKYNTQSALNNFSEYSMVDPMDMSHYFGFTRAEVKALAEKHHADFDELEKWYDGYRIGDEPAIFNPNSVMMALRSLRCKSYWANTGAYEAVADYIKMNFDGLRDTVIQLLAGERCPVDTSGFNNDMHIINSRDDVLTVLIHLGYLSYDWQNEECYIPNREVAGEMVNAVKSNQWQPLISSIQASRQLLQSTLEGDCEAVARGVDAAHDDNTSILSYNNENSLACVLSLAYYYARNDYVMYRELPTGKGFADIVLLPRKNVDSPAIVLELKYDRDAVSAISQIHRKQYPAKVAQYVDNLLLVAINYDKQTKTHQCVIEEMKK